MLTIYKAAFQAISPSITLKIRAEICTLWGWGVSGLSAVFFFYLFHRQCQTNLLQQLLYSVNGESCDIREKTCRYLEKVMAHRTDSFQSDFSSFGRLKFGHLRVCEGWGAFLWSLFKILHQSLLLIVVHLKKLALHYYDNQQSWVVLTSLCSSIIAYRTGL